MIVNPNLDTVTAMIAPALFLTATGSVLISTANRIGRIVDRIRVLVALCESGELEKLDFSERRREHALVELKHLAWRSRMTAIAVTALYMAFSSFSMTSLVIAIDALSGNRLAVLPTVFAIGGVGLLLIACMFLVLEARESLRGNGREVRFFYELDELRRSQKGK